MFIILIIFNTVSELVWVSSIAPSHPHIFGIQTPVAVARLVACPLCIALYANSPNIEPLSVIASVFRGFSLLRLYKKSKLSVTGQKNGH